MGYKWGGVRVEGEIFGCSLVGNVWCLVAVWLGFGGALVQGLLAGCQRNLGALHWVSHPRESFGPWRCRANPDATCTELRGRRNMSDTARKYEEIAQFGNLWKTFGNLWKSLEDLWKSLEIFGNLWKSMKILGNVWKSLEILGFFDFFGNLWKPMFFVKFGFR